MNNTKLMQNMSFETQCVHGSYKADEGEPQVFPIVQNTTYRYYDTAEMAKLFDLESDKFMYSRLGSPTVNNLEEKFALLEGGTAAVSASSGQSATLMCFLNFCKAGDHIISSTSIYGGTFNLLSVTLNRLGIDVDFVDPELSIEEIIKYAKPNTKAIFGETIANPALTLLDFEKFSCIAKKLEIPFIVDNTLASPALCKPIEHGADIVIQSTTKWADGHATCVGGMVVEAGTFNWNQNDKFPELAKPDDSYHGLCFYDKFKNTAFSVRLRAVVLRDLGCTMSPMNSYLTAQGLQTLHIRMERHCENALALANFLENHEKVDWVTYPGLDSSKFKSLSNKYLPKGSGGVLTFGVKGGKKAGENFLSKLELASLVVHVGDIRTSVIHPASTTHRQLSEEEQIAGGTRPELIRVSVGIENINDIINDFDNALISI